MSKKNPAFAIFGQYPGHGFKSLADAIPYAEKLPDGFRVIWLLQVSGSKSYMISRAPYLVAAYDDSPGTCTRVWENGVVLIPQPEEQIEQPAPAALPQVSESQEPRITRQKVRKVCEKIDSAIAVSIFDVIEQLKKSGLSAEKILDVVSALKPEQ